MLAPGTRTRALAAWKALVAAPHDLDLVWAAPVVLRPDVQEWILASAPELADAEVVNQLDAIRAGVARDDRNYALGNGPIEALWEAVRTGRISSGMAVATAASLPVTEALTAGYVSALLLSFALTARRYEDWRWARERGRIVLAAVDGCDRRLDLDLHRARCVGELAWATACLTSVPDGEMLAAALRCADELQALPPDPAHGNWDALFYRASLWTTPYTTDRSIGRYDVQLEQWRRRGQREHGEVDGRTVESWRMPEPADALATGAAAWQDAVDAYPDDPHMLEALANTLYLQAGLAGFPTPDTLPALVRHGLGVAGDDERLHTAFESLARALGLEVALDDEAAAEDSDAVVAEHGRLSGDLVWRAVLNRVRADPAAALAIVERHSWLLRDPVQLTDRSFRDLCQRVVGVLNRVHGSMAADPEPVPGADFDECVREVFAGLPATSSPIAYASAALRLAVYSGLANREPLGLQLVSAIREQAPYFVQRWDWVVDVVEAELFLGEAVNRYDDNDYPQALHIYSLALDRWSRLSRDEPVRDIVDRLADIASGADEEAASRVAGVLAGAAPKIAARLGEALDGPVGAVFQGVLGALVDSGQLNSEVVWGVVQYAKGARTAMLLDRRSRVDARRDPGAAAMLGQLADPAVGPASRASLRRAFDARLRQLAFAGLDTPVLLGLAQTRYAIDERTVVLSTATTQDAEGRVARIGLFVTADDQILLTTGYHPVEQVPWLPGSLLAELAEQRALGRDHLCVIGDSAVHDFPWHVYGEHPLADDWTVSLLPHPHLLLDARGGPKIARAGLLPVLAVGVDDADHDTGLVPLPDAEAEARVVATALAGRTLLGPQASVEAVRAAIPHARYVHIATHGLFDPTTPAFHSLVLDDDELPAWQVAELDLTSVDLVTLSACNTARIAERSGDNVDGLPIAFLAAGARCVIGTTTEIPTDASRMFFETLYASIGVARDWSPGRDFRDHFRAAFVAVRAAFTDPRVWSSFYLLGDWREL